MGWRYQIPYLLSLNLKVIAPDLLGYGQTSAPSEVGLYSFKRMSGHLTHLIRAETENEPIILGGHDWGAFLAWRLAMYSPDLFTGVFAFCIPYFPPLPFVMSLEEFVKQFPNFQYQLQLASPVAESIGNKSHAHLCGFLRSMFGGVTPDGLPGFDVSTGLIEET